MTLTNLFSYDSVTADDFDGVQPYLIPDGYVWTDQTLRSWTNRGTGNILNLT